MDAERIAIANACLKAAHDGNLSFPEIIGKLIAAGFDGYEVDYRRNTQTYYLSDRGSLVLDMPQPSGAVAAAFKVTEIERLVRWAQSNAIGYSYAAFSAGARDAGCAGYLVSFLGRRVLYFGRTAETHVEHFPN
jgi:uncharacterized protein YbcV (DUF1398 family)